MLEAEVEEVERPGVGRKREGFAAHRDKKRGPVLVVVVVVGKGSEDAVG